MILPNGKGGDMRRQILKGMTTLMIAAALVLVAGVATANGQSGNKLVAQVPFEFIVGDQILASGEYNVRTVTNAGDTLMIKNADAKDRAIRLTSPTGHRTAKNYARLVFHRYGNRYFLSEVWMSDERVGRELRKSKQERAIQRELAAIPSKGDLASGNYEVVEVLGMAR
jgi:hypothetical protein